MGNLNKNPSFGRESSVSSREKGKTANKLECNLMGSSSADGILTLI